MITLPLPDLIQEQKASVTSVPFFIIKCSPVGSVKKVFVKIQYLPDLIFSKKFHYLFLNFFEKKSCIIPAAEGGGDI